MGFTATTDVRSQRVVQRMLPAGELDHPVVPEASPLRRHVLHRARRTAWSPVAR